MKLTVSLSVCLGFFLLLDAQLLPEKQKILARSLFFVLPVVQLIAAHIPAQRISQQD